MRKRRRRSFEEWLEDARLYREVHGNLLVPNDYVTPEGNRLGRWIERKRAQYNGVRSINGHLCSDEIAALDAIGMVWKLEYRFRWDIWMQQAALFYDTYGHLNVPKEYTNGKYSLGHWLIEQRKKYAAGMLSDTQIADLEKYHVKWELLTPHSWDEWYAIAEKYYKTHGNLRVRADYVTDDGERLGRWICSQRDCYNGRPGKRSLLASEIEKLEKLGMIWSIAEEKNICWTDMLEQTKEYMAKYNRLPPRTSEKVMTADGRNLTNWVRAQQDRYRKGLLRKERAEALIEAGVIRRREKKKEAFVYDRKETGSRICKMRIFLRISMEKAASDLKMAEEEYAEIESGIRGMSLDTAMRITSYYNISLEYLAYGRWAVSGHVYTQESAVIICMLQCREAEKRERAARILQTCLTE